MSVAILQVAVGTHFWCWCSSPSFLNLISALYWKAWTRDGEIISLGSTRVIFLMGLLGLMKPIKKIYIRQGLTSEAQEALGPLCTYDSIKHCDGVGDTLRPL